VPCWWTPRCATSRSTVGVSLITPNQLETEQATGIRHPHEDDLLAAGARILRKLAAAPRS
jgi:hypothetical protein